MPDPVPPKMEKINKLFKIKCKLFKKNRQITYLRANGSTGSLVGSHMIQILFLQRPILSRRVQRLKWRL